MTVADLIQWMLQLKLWQFALLLIGCCVFVWLPPFIEAFILEWKNDESDS